MSQLRRVFSGLAQSCTKPTMVPTPPETSIRLLIVFTRSSGVPMVEAAASPPAVFSTASSGEVNGCRPGRCSVPTLYSLCQRIKPAPASRRACSRVSAMCQLSSTRQSDRLTVVPCFFAASSAKPHWVGSAIRPCVDIEPSEMMPMPYLPASVMPDGEICDATTNGMSSCRGRICSAASFMTNHSLLAVTRSPGNSQKHLGRGDGFPTRRMVLAAPEFVITERVELVDEIEVAAELQHRMLADRVMRGEEGSELKARHC